MLVSLWMALALVCLCRGLNVPTPSPDQCTSHTLDNHRLNATRLKFDDVTSQRVNATSAKDCIRKCCSANATTKHPCSIAEFNYRLEPLNCVLVFCHWLDEECQNNVIAGKVENVSTSSIVRVAAAAPSTAIDRILSDSTPKIERTIKPRKGVGYVAAEQVTEQPVTSGVLPTPSATESQSPDTTTDPTVSSDTVSTPAAETTSTGDSSLTTSGELSAATSGSDVTPLPDLDADKHKHTVPRKGVLGAFSELSTESATHSNYTIPESKHSESIKGIGSAQIEIKMHPKNSSNPEPTTGSKKESAVIAAPKMESSLKIPEPLTPVSNQKSGGTPMHQKVSTYHKLSSAPPNRTVTSDNQTGGSIVHVVPPTTKKELSNQTTTATVSSVAPPTTNDIYLNSQQTDELTIQQSVYLIASLIIGFLVLLTVIGLVMRHVHGVWERRHYQRMDFLIDGMYNNM